MKNNFCLDNFENRKKRSLGILFITALCIISQTACFSQVWSGDTLSINPITFADASPEGWGAQYEITVEFPEVEHEWAKILMIQTLKCDSATAGDQYPCGEWDYIWNTLIKIPRSDSTEIFSIGSFVTPYGKRLVLGGEAGWEWVYDISEYAPLLRGKREVISGNNQELLDLKFIFIKGLPARKVLSVENVYPQGEYKYEYLATDSLLKKKELVLSGEASGFRLKAVVSGHGHAGPRNCCEWDSKTHSYYINNWETYRWNVWKDCGNNPIYPQGGTWPFDRAGWCPGSKVDEYDFEITPKVSPGDTITIDYGIENFSDNGEKDGFFRMSHQLFSYGAPNFNYDAAIVEIISPSLEDRFSRINSMLGKPQVVIQNNGKYTLRRLSIHYGISGKRKTSFEWFGELEFLESEVIGLPPIKLKKLNEINVFEVVIKSQRKHKDENLQNNRMRSEFKAPNELPRQFVLAIKTNNLKRALENSYVISDSEGLVWFSGDAFEDDKSYSIPIELPKGIYQFKYSDEMEDGVSVHWWNRTAAPEMVGMKGSVRIESTEGDTLMNFNSDFGQELYLNFIVK